MDRIERNPEPEAAISLASSEEHFTMDTVRNVVVPVLQEEVVVEKRLVTTGAVLIRKLVHETEHVVEEPVQASHIDVERVSVNRIVDGPIPVRYEGQTAIYSVIEEVVVVTKQFVLKEELRVTTRTSESQDRQQITLRTEELVIERSAAEQPK